MRLPIYQIDAFASRIFAGNPAAVVPLDAWLPDAQMQAIAAENNLSETAFFVSDDVEGRAGWHLRWFTPKFEVPLCGHATLASAWLISERLAPGTTPIRFMSKSGVLTVTRDGDVLTLDFPARPPFDWPREPIAALAAALGRTPRETYRSPRPVMCVFDDEDDIRAIAPDMAALVRDIGVAVLVTAPGRDCDFVSRYFAPHGGIPEDPVTGSAHCVSVPYWARRLGKTKLLARQLSARGGELACEDRGTRVLISGRAALYMEGAITV
jgi:PhzF family phenazine biosynthesis protein